MRYKHGILLAATKDSAFTIGTMIINLEFIMKEKIDIYYVFHDGISENDKNILQNYVSMDRIKFCDFTKEIFMSKINQFINVGDINDRFLDRYTHMSFARYEAFELMSECEKIIYLDFDMLLLKDIGELFELNTNLSAIQGTAKMDYALGFKLEGIDNNEKNISTGIIVFNNIPNKKYTDFIYSFIAEHIDCIFNGSYVDQAIFTLLIKKYGLSLTQIDPIKYYGIISWLASKNSSIIHACGQNNRFWNNGLCAISWPEWYVYYNKWISLGGSEYKGGLVKYADYPKKHELFQYFEKVEWIDMINKFEISNFLTLLYNHDNKKVCFKINTGNSMFFNNDFIVEIRSQSIYTFQLILFDSNAIVFDTTFPRDNLEKELKNIIRIATKL